MTAPDLTGLLAEVADSEHGATAVAMCSVRVGSAWADPSARRRAMADARERFGARLAVGMGDPAEGDQVVAVVAAAAHRAEAFAACRALTEWLSSPPTQGS